MPGGKSIQEINKIAFVILDDLNFSADDFKHSNMISIEKDQVRYLATSFARKRAGRIVNDSIPALVTEVIFRPPSKLLPARMSNKKDEEGISGSQKFMSGTARLRFNSKGELLFLRISDNRRDSLQTLSYQQQFNLAQKLVKYTPFKSLANFQLDTTNSGQLPNAVMRTFLWKRKSKLANESIQISASVKNNLVHRFQVEYKNPSAAAKEKDQGLFGVIFEALYILSIIALVLYYFIKRLRSDQISIRSGIVLAALTAMSMAITIIAKSQNVSLLEIIIATLFGVPIMTIAAGILVAVGESVSRDLPRDRFETMEALNHGKLQFQPVGNGLVTGFLMACIFAGLIAVAYWGFSILNVSFLTLKPDAEQQLGWIFPGIALGGTILQFHIFNATASRLLILPLLLRWFRRPWLAILLASLPVSFFAFSLQKVFPLYFSFGIGFLYGLALCWLFYRFDFLTSLLAGIFVDFLFGGRLLVQLGSLIPAANGWILIGGVFLLLLIGIYVARYGKSQLASVDLRPDYVYRLADRERLHRELEIARDVQLNFLPHDTPDIPHLQIASICIPANEVGGDYYDFIQINETKLGIVIGDVSGKGIPAAFYMTLTKGILKSLISEKQSPREVLIKTNQLFYENARRGVFISLIYGIFDFEKRTFTFARAGHNPPIHWNDTTSTSQFLMPMGLAIGLERGELFRSTIEERTIPFNQGDIFVFYTDGFSEAMNHQQQEFGEKRLVEIVLAYQQKDASQLLESCQNAVQQFSKGNLQHDDMTMIIVKIQRDQQNHFLIQ